MTNLEPKPFINSEINQAKGNAFKYFKSHLKNRNLVSFPTSGEDTDKNQLFRSVFVIKPIIQPKVSNEELSNKRLIKK